MPSSRLCRREAVELLQLSTRDVRLSPSPGTSLTHDTRKQMKKVEALCKMELITVMDTGGQTVLSVFQVPYDMELWTDSTISIPVFQVSYE
jgi:hypothetical protein